MDPTASNLPNTQSPEVIISPSPRKSVFWIIWIIGIIFLLILTILSLNYFNIIPLSKSYPQYLPFLPHKPVQTRVSPALITITEQRAKTDSENIIAAYINPSYISPEKEISEIIAPKPPPNKTAFTITWKASDGITIKVTTEYLDGNLHNYQQLTFELPDGLIKELNASNAASIAEKYLSFKIQSAPRCEIVNIDTKQSTLCDIALANKSQYGNVGVQIIYPLQ